MTAILAIDAPRAATGDTAVMRGWLERPGPATRRWERNCPTRLVEVAATFAVMGTFVVALFVMAGEWLGDSTAVGVADSIARTVRVAMPHVAEASASAAATGACEPGRCDRGFAAEVA